MTRLNNKKELWRHLSTVNLVKDSTGTFGSTTLAAAPSIGATSISCAANTNFSNGDLIRYGSGDNWEYNEINGSITGAGPYSFPVKYPVALTHASGEAVVEQTKTPLGHIVDGGVTVAFEGDDNAVNSATRRLVLGYLTGHIGITASFGVLGMNAENWMAAMGSIDTSTNITGSGTPSAPYRGVIDATKAKEIFDIGLFFDGTRKDAGIVDVQLWGVEFNPTAVQSVMGRGAAAGISVSVHACSGIAVIQYN